VDVSSSSSTCALHMLCHVIYIKYGHVVALCTQVTEVIYRCFFKFKISGSS